MRKPTFGSLLIASFSGVLCAWGIQAVVVLMGLIMRAGRADIEHAIYHGGWFALPYLLLGISAVLWSFRLAPSQLILLATLAMLVIGLPLTFVGFSSQLVPRVPGRRPVWELPWQYLIPLLQLGGFMVLQVMAVMASWLEDCLAAYAHRCDEEGSAT